MNRRFLLLRMARVAGAATAVAALLAIVPAQALAQSGKRVVAAANDAAALYHNYCSVCHGDKGDGRSRAQNSLHPPPRDFTTPAAAQELSRARMILGVKEGRPGTAMTGWKTQLDERQIELVVDYVRDSFMVATGNTDSSRGRALYAKNCSVCHGDRGQASAWAKGNLNPPPRDFTAPAALAELSRDRMIAAVAAGRPGTAMAGFATQLSRDDIGAVVDFVQKSLMQPGVSANISGTSAHGTSLAPAAAPAGAPAAPKAGAPAVASDMSLPMPAGLVGVADRGKRFYDANCATCHGVKGDGAGPRAYFIRPRPRNFATPEARAVFNRPLIYAAVATGRNGTEMPAWDKVMTPQEMADVSEYVFRTFIRSGAQDTAQARAR
ncbi:MAG: c-type cytochrome [Burkholderiales bacterium]|nr:c-type cytochrome [Burkholderiales bacterium]